MTGDDLRMFRLDVKDDVNADSNAASPSVAFDIVRPKRHTPIFLRQLHVNTVIISSEKREYLQCFVLEHDVNLWEQNDYSEPSCLRKGIKFASIIFVIIRDICSLQI